MRGQSIQQEAKLRTEKRTTHLLNFLLITVLSNIHKISFLSHPSLSSKHKSISQILILIYSNISSNTRKETRTKQKIRTGLSSRPAERARRERKRDKRQRKMEILINRAPSPVSIYLLESVLQAAFSFLCCNNLSLKLH